MVILEVYSKCLKIKYKTRLCSKATLFTLVTTIVSVIIPFVFAYNSRGFWIKHDTFYEQPDIKFRGEYLFNAITSNISAPIVCSSIPYFESFSQFDKCSLIKVREFDNNMDGKVDDLEFSLNIPTPVFRILSFYLVLVFDYHLHTVCPMAMQTAIITKHNSHSFTTSEINIVGNMGLLQTSPLHCHPKWINRQYNYSVIQNSYNSFGFDVSSIIHNYSRRNVSTHLSNEYTTFETDTSNSDLVVKLKINFPEHQVYYAPSFWQVVKWAWIQYFAIYIIFAWIMQKIKYYVFENKLVLFYEASPLKKDI